MPNERRGYRRNGCLELSTRRRRKRRREDRIPSLLPSFPPSFPPSFSLHRGGGRRAYDTEGATAVGDEGRKLVRAERIILVRHGESMGNVDEGGNQWFEMDDSSCELIGFQKRHTKGSLWRILRDIHEEGIEEGREGGGEGEGEEGVHRDVWSEVEDSEQRSRRREGRRKGGREGGRS
ncbi:hypothetical protein NSK_008460 [Nannochloropsis salina CCMP1776]|uniref:Uncharacterized protein n=1 Tax=Nannochloropsis salina CCMP1776 TaxID=1027361 RepID=A0A4D9CNW3_9STRA|nr:hypothetical protein NSK_008460 [Nannochloropsis salina CCMP1776]|eukprot:TFJ80204.1 hypothetical protein NSK_008460 [Nannochloropsis salina CCMP1776]